MNDKSLCAKTRLQLEVTQIEMALMFGVHPVTIARWEATTGRCQLRPNAWQAACLEVIGAGLRAHPNFRHKIRKALDDKRPHLALYLALRSYFLGREERTNHERLELAKEKERRS